MAYYRHYHVQSLSSGMEDLPCDWLNNIFEDPLLTDRVISDIAPTPHIQAEHSYSLMTEPTPPSPLLPGFRLDDFGKDLDTDGLGYSSTAEHTVYGIKQEPPMDEYETALNLSTTDDCMTCDLPAPQPPRIQMTTTPIFNMSQSKPRVQYRIKQEHIDMDIDNDSLHDPTMEQVHMPPTPPSSTPSDSEGGLSPHRSASEPGSPPCMTGKQIPSMTLAQPHTTSTVSSQQPREQQQQHTSTSGPKIVQHPVITTQLNQKIPPSGAIILSEEEKRTLVQEGYPIPTKLPLTKAEEKSLKKVRRKIKNKISAQESRRKKKEYVDCLEKRVEGYTSENTDLRKKLESLENTNKALMSQLHRLQALVSKVSKPIKATSTQTGTCLMVLVLFFALFLGSWSPTPTTDSSGYIKMPHQSSASSNPSEYHSHKSYGPVPASATYDPYSTPSIRSSRVLLSVEEEGSYPEPPYPYASKLDNLGKLLEENNTGKPFRVEALDANVDEKALIMEKSLEMNYTKIHPDMKVAEMSEYQAVMHPDIATEIHAKYVAMETMARINNTSSK
ncbi:CREB-like transcription factor [Saccoglossus kowalevskii]|uniref:CREB-like transcription factor n=1 Tax=Saccoglossus kowalevskii TaxID=10224 RepID=D1LWZ2_SACKO|nr:CREB-like transcription factor [Saccoglossus kowalevskii]ACY92498.1 CREB-like transcription factor [Saccoglossus kowalevskii]